MSMDFPCQNLNKFCREKFKQKVALQVVPLDKFIGCIYLVKSFPVLLTKKPSDSINRDGNVLEREAMGRVRLVGVLAKEFKEVARHFNALVR